MEDARDRLVAMNRPVPEPTEAAIAESDAEERSHQPLHFTDSVLGLIRQGPTVVEAVHVGEPTLSDPQPTLAPSVSKETNEMAREAYNAGKPQPAEAVPAPTTANEPPRSDRPSEAPESGLAAPAGGTGVGVEVVSAPSGSASAGGQQTDPNALVKPVGPANTALPPVEKASEAPIQTNDIKGSPAAQPISTNGKKPKKPKTDLSDESSSKKKKKKGLDKLNPF